jgi:hypothetical protein
VVDQTRKRRSGGELLLEEVTLDGTLEAWPPEPPKAPKPSTLDPGATGRFDARAFFDPTERKWRVAARYLPPEADYS